MREICLNIAGYRCFRETFKKCVRLRVCHCLFVRACVCVCLCHPECPWVSWYILPRLRLGRSQVVCSSFNCGKMKFQFPAARSVGRIKRMRAEKKVWTPCTYSLRKLSWASTTDYVSCAWTPLGLFSLSLFLPLGISYDRNAVNNFRCLMNFN